MSLPLWIVVAVAKNGVIGGDNKLLWHIRADLQRFKALTLGKPMLMGRKTFESIGKALPGRETIVITRDVHFAAPNVHVAHDLGQGLALAQRLGLDMGAEAVAVVGGGEIYRQTLAQAAKIYLTQVDLAPQGDTSFPALDMSLWREVQREAHQAGPKDDADFIYIDYERR